MKIENMQFADIDLPLKYWDERKEFLKQARSWLIRGKVKMVKKKNSCKIIFYIYQGDHLFYIVNNAINFGGWLKSKGYRTLHNPMDYLPKP